MRVTEDSVVWITGASSGIGRALALAYSAEGCTVVLSARRTDVLEEVRRQCAHPDKAVVLPLDLTDAASMDEAAKQVTARFGAVDLLVLNGGISQRSLVRETPMDIDRRLMETDYFGAVQLAKAMLPGMLAAGHGHFAVISSIVGIFGFPQRSAYSAAKHALHGFFETLRAEEGRNGIRVTMVCPGRILTDVSLHALTKEGKEYGVMDHAQANGISAETCAQKIMRAVRRNRKEIYVCRKDVLMVYFRRYIPALYYTLASRVKPN